jgi:hypothetical protein
MGEIWALIKALPALISTIREVFAFIQKTFGDTPEKFLKSAGEAFALLNQADTPEKKVEAARAIQNLIRRT